MGALLILFSAITNRLWSRTRWVGMGWVGVNMAACILWTLVIAFYVTFGKL